MAIIGKASGKPFEVEGLVGVIQGGFDAQSGGRLDRDEQLFGRIAEDGVIVNIVDADRGIVQVALKSGVIVTGVIQQFTAPVLTLTSRVLVLQTEREFAHILPLAQYPPQFAARVVRVNGSGAYKTAELRHSLGGLGDGGAIVAPALHNLDIDPGDIVLVATASTDRVTDALLGANHFITGKVRAAAQAGGN